MTPPDLLLNDRSASKSEPNQHTINSIQASINAVHAIISLASGDESSADPRSELDTHANMVVLGKNAYIFEQTGKTCDVKPFTDDLGIATNIPVVDGAIAYDCPYSRETFILILRNALYIKTMENNLIPPFIMRQGGAIVNDIPKIQCLDPSIDDHCIKFTTCDLRIPLQLIGVFSYFHTRKPTSKELFDKDKIFLTPDSSNWNPHCLSFEQNERTMLNYEGELNEPRRRENKPMTIDNDDNDIFELSSVTVESWQNHVDSNYNNAYIADDNFDNTSDDFDNQFAKSLNIRAEISKVQATLGSTTLNELPCQLFQGPATTAINTLESSLAKVLTQESMENVMSTLSSTVAGKPHGIKASQLSKLWLITDKLAEGAITQNTQLSRLNSDNTLSRHLSSNDRMLRYRRINSTFFTDTMFSTPKAKSLRQNTCCQVYVSDKGYVSVYPMKTQEEFKTSLHWFCKQVGVSSNLIVDGHKAQTSAEVKRFCDQVGTTLKILERGTPWANRAELYIGLLN